MKRLLAMFLVCAYAVAVWASVTVTVNGTNYTIPQTNERGWGNSVTSWIQAMSQYSLQPTGGTFALTNDVNFGANYGLKSKYFSTRDANPASSGFLRLTKSDSIGFRNNANDGNLLLAIDSSDRLTFGGVILPSATAGSFQDSTFNLYDNGDVTKKIAFEASGISTGTTRTVSIPDADVNLGGLTNSNIDASAAIAYSKLNLSGSIVNSDIGIGAAIALSKLAPLSNSVVPVTNGSGILTSSAVTATTLGYLDATSSVQTQLDAKLAKSTLTTKGDIYVATGSAAVSRVGVGTNNQVLTADSGQSAGVKWADPPSNPTTTKGDLSTYDTAPARLGVGTNGQFLVADSSQAKGLIWKTVSIDFTGQVFFHGKSTCPSHSMAADGSAVSRTTYARLYSEIGTTFGAGDGSTTFNVPNAQAVVLRGTGSQTINGRSKSGPSLGSIQEDQIQGHYHTLNRSDYNLIAGTTTSFSSNAGAGSNNYTQMYTSVQPVTSPSTDGTNGTPRTGDETRVNSLGMKACIYYEAHL